MSYFGIPNRFICAGKQISNNKNDGEKKES
jgi:hypothetical protein